MNFCGGRLAPPSFSVSSAMRPSKQPTPKHATDFARPLVGGSSPRALMRLQEFCKNLASDLARAPTKSVLGVPPWSNSAAEILRLAHSADAISAPHRL